MRTVHVVIFVLGTLSFLVAAIFAEQVIGAILWRVGVGCMLTDLVILRLWPAAGPS